MQNSHLLQLTKNLTKKEIKGLQHFLNAPFFNKRPEVNTLFDYLIKYQHSKPERLAKANVYKQLRPGQTYDDQQLRLWMSWLLKLIERFLVLNAFENDEIAWELTLCRIYREKQLDRHLERQLKRTRRQLQKSEFKNATHHQFAFTLELESYRSLGQKGRMSNLNLQEMSDQLDSAYLSHKLQLACLMLTHQAVYKAEYELGLLPQILSYIQTKQLTKQAAIGLYYAAYRMLSTPGEAQFQSFKSLLLAHGQQFPPDERGDLYLLGINFCIRQYNQGEPAYLSDELELYREGLQQELFYRNQHLSRFTYRNIVTVGLVLEEYAWVEEFIYAYRLRLAPQHRVSMYSFCLAYLAYSRKQYDEALLLLQKANYRDLLLNLAAKALLIKIFHELDETDLLYAHLDAMQQFIRRKKQLVYHHNHYLQLIYFTRRLHELPPSDRQRKTQLQEEIEATKELAEKRWLLMQLT